MTNVTKTFFPPLKEYNSFLERIWRNEWLTNRGELALELENKLKTFLEVDNIILMNNGTIPLQIALKILANQGEVITTPFSYIATTASILWQNCIPKFVDIENDSLNIDASKIENAITNRTTCILATHVFGNPCDVEEIDKISKKYNLKVIYDAAHCFGVKYKERSIFDYGDISTCSFHATKLFHTGEGGGVFCKDPELRHKLFYSHNFGHRGSNEFYGLGINGKISELQAAMGLSVLPYINEILESRRKIVNYYNSNLDFSKFSKMKLKENTKWNYSYFPIIFQSEKVLLETVKRLNEENIFPRRYFYPSLNKIPFVNGEFMKNSESIASRILCLPLFHDLGISEIQKIISVLSK